MGKATQYSTSAFTTDKLKKFGVSGHAPGGKHGDGGGDDYGKRAAETSDSSSFAEGGAAKAPSLGRAGRARGGRIGRPAVTSTTLEASKTGGNVGGKVPDNEGGKARDLSILTDGGPRSYGDRPLIVGKGGNALRAKGGRVARAHGGRTKGAKGKTVVNVIVDSSKGQQPPAPPPMAATGPVPPPMPPPQPPKPPMMPPGAGGPPMGPPGGAPMGPMGAPPGGMPPPPMGRARGGRINEKFGSGSGRGRLEKTKRENHGKVMLAE